MNVVIVNSRVREQLLQRCAADGVQFFEARAANVVQLDEVQLGEGAVLYPFVTLKSDIRIGQHFHANIYSYVEHDCVVGLLLCGCRLWGVVGVSWRAGRGRGWIASFLAMTTPMSWRAKRGNPWTASCLVMR